MPSCFRGEREVGVEATGEIETAGCSKTILLDIGVKASLAVGSLDVIQKAANLWWSSGQRVRAWRIFHAYDQKRKRCFLVVHSSDD